MYQFTGNQGVGKKTLTGGGSHIWISDEPAKTALTFSGSNPWTGQLAFNSAPASSSIMIEIGYSTNGADFTAAGPEKLMGDGENNVLPYTTNSSSFTVPSGKYLAVKVTNYTGVSHDLLLGLWVSFASPPGISCTNTTFYRDVDGDGHGSSGNTLQACTHPEGYVSNSTDCDDNDELEHPDQTWYKDADGDEYSDGTTNTASCTRPAGYYASSELISTTGDCNDGAASINPGASEVCNGLDENCNDQIDEGVQNTYYADDDEDGCGNPNSSTQACTTPAGFVTNHTDCDDNDPLEHPNQTWYKDADADGYSDGGTNTTSCTRPGGYYIGSELTETSGDCDDGDSDEFPNQIWYQDIDGDGYGNRVNSAQSCTRPDGYVADNTDCDDSNGAIYPGKGCGIAMPWIQLLLFDN
ncbi:MAG: putative metal-binding motif-containing protein [Deltaproteobacteria bacterium]|nr:putative metal-binding motif-containing protein [Deltaproteobacteria bacterium]